MFTFLKSGRFWWTLCHPWMTYALSVLVVILLPFFVLVRGAVWFYHAGWGGYPSVIAASLLSMAVLFAYMIAVDHYLVRRRLIPLKVKLIIVTVVIVVYNIYCLWAIDDKHIKSGEKPGEYASLHPLLRVAVGTMTYFDSRLVVTDMARTPEEYRKLGLTPLQQSLHYPQEDGYVYAVDIRTRDRFFLFNWIIKLSFRLLGFKARRHTGNADHLHVALPRRR